MAQYIVKRLLLLFPTLFVIAVGSFAIIHYWKVDTIGQQLPYIDRMAIDVVEGGEAVNFKAMAGEVDMQSRYMSFSNFTLFVENEAKGDFRVQQWINPIPDALKFNLTYKDLVLRELFNERDFRIAMSKAIDRQEIGDLIYLGVGFPWQAVPAEADPFFVPPVHLDYDPDGANRLLDGIGLTARDGDNFRLRPDGEELQIIISSYGAEEAGGNDMLELIKDYGEAVGIRTAIKVEDRSLWTERRASGDFMVNAYLTAGIHWSIDPNWYVPETVIQNWRLKSPGYTNVEQYWIEG